MGNLYKRNSELQWKFKPVIGWCIEIIPAYNTNNLSIAYIKFYNII